MKEKYISFTKNVQSTEDKRKKNNIKLHFIDSYTFLISSLDKLASYLSKDKLRIMQRECIFVMQRECNFVIYQQKISIFSHAKVFFYEYIGYVYTVPLGRHLFSIFDPTR